MSSKQLALSHGVSYKLLNISFGGSTLRSIANQDSWGRDPVRNFINSIFIGLLWLSLPVISAEREIRNIRFWAAPDHTRVVFDVSLPISHNLFTLENPNRLVIDIPSTRVTVDLGQLGGKGLVAGIRAGQFSPDVTRIVLDLKRPVQPRSFALKPNDQYGHRLVIDLYEFDASDKPKNTVKKSVFDKVAIRDLIIAIDAGHGGDDPGAVGRHGTQEKHIVLAIAKRLANLIEKEPGMRPVLIRSGDYYVGLRQRINKARKHKADMFVSIHADGFKDRRVRGASVFTLSRRGASSEMARRLAEKENAADLVGGVSLADKDDLLAEVLLDLSQNATQEASFEVAGIMLDELKRLGKIHKSSVQQAGFVVLKSPDIPSVLVETAFISNAAEERKLKDKSHQQALARAMLRGIQGYFSRYPPPGTYRVAKQHTIQRGDTLSEIAAHYRVNLVRLKGYNKIKSDHLRVGRVLRIPPAGS